MRAECARVCVRERWRERACVRARVCVCVRESMRACARGVCVCMRARVRACVRVCVRARAHLVATYFEPTTFSPH